MSAPETAVEGLRAPRQERSEATLKAMVTAGRALINASGSLTGFSLAELTRAASTSVGAFYTRFRDKETFCAVVLDDTLAGIRADLDASMARDAVWNAGPASAVAAGIVGFYVGIFRTHGGLFAAYLRHASAGGTLWLPIRAANQRLLDAMVPCLAGHVRAERGPWPDEEVRMAIKMVVSVLANVVLDVPNGLDLHDPALERRLAAMLDRYLAGAGPVA
jgi:AcrR family transcriptional regulator